MISRKLVLYIWTVALFAALATGLAHAQEDVTFPDFTGAYAVGKVERQLVDPTRDEVFTDDPDDKRELMLTVYYPAQPSADAAPAPYVEGAVAAALDLTPGVVALIHTQVYTEAPVADGEPTYPVIIFSPGMGNLPLSYSIIQENLASSGYIVVSISHPYSTAITVFPDGRVVLMNDAGGRLHTDSEEADAVTRANILDIWVHDVRFVLDALEQGSASDPLFGGHLDLRHIGMFGHSFGGETTIETSALDSRIKAALSLDSQVNGSVRETGIRQPFMILRSERLSVSDEDLEAAGVTRDQFDAMYDAIDAPIIDVYEGASTGYLLSLEDSMHDTFTADYLVLASLFPAEYPPEVIGTINRSRAVNIIDTYVVAFFDKHLKGEAVPLLDAPSSDFPEVTFERHEN